MNGSVINPATIALVTVLALAVTAAAATLVWFIVRRVRGAREVPPTLDQ